jgi:peptidoglycan/LPS O-acetylase OafA/YrhL
MDGIRGLAALIVVFHHGLLNFTNALFNGEKRDSHFNWDVHLAGKPFLLFFAGNFSVAIFFVLSGFVLSHVFSRASARPIELAVRRYVRLTIPITASNLFSLLLCCAASVFPFFFYDVPNGPGFYGSLADAPWAFFACLKESFLDATILGRTQPATYNGALWTMQIEFFGSMMLIAMFWIAKKFSGDIRGIMNVAAGLACMIAIFWWQSTLSLFACGVIFYRLVMDGFSPRWWKELLAIPLFVSAIYLGTMPQAFSRPQFQTNLIAFTGMDMDKIAHETVIYPVLDYFHLGNWVPFPFLPVNIWHAIGAVLLLASVLLSERLRDFFSRPAFLFLGYISFSLYLIHPTVQHVTAQPIMDALVRFGMGKTPAMLIGLFVFVGASLWAATWFTKLVEGRSIRWSERISARIATHATPGVAREA